MRIGSLFSGAGGLDMAVQAVFGGDVMWHSEVDPAASKVLAHRFPDVPNLGDITQVDWTQVEPVDVLCGGFPCQDVSAAGRRAGIKDGTRSGLWAIFADAIAALKPSIVVIENVRGLLSATAHREEPDDRVPCVCGWLDRWRGLHSSLREREGSRADLSGPCDDRYDRAGAASAEVATSGMGWLTVELKASDRAVERGVGVEPNRRPSARPPAAGIALLEAEGTAGSLGSGSGEDSGRPTSKAEWQWGMELASACRVRSDQEQTASAQRQGRACDECGGFIAADATDRAVESDQDVVGDESDGPLLRAAGAVCGDLADLGYDAQWATVSAASVGAPHRRERVFIVATDTAHSYGRLEYRDCSQVADSRGTHWKGDNSRQDAADTSSVGWHEGRTEPAGIVGGSDAALSGDGPVELLPTPTAQSAKHDADDRGPGTLDDFNLWSVAARIGRGELLPTPQAFDSCDFVRTPEQIAEQATRPNGGGARNLREVVINESLHLLPTPVAHDGKGSGPSGYARNTPDLQCVDYYFLPTPCASDGDPKGGPNNPNNRLAQGHHVQLLDMGMASVEQWGKYTAAIRRWEQVTRPVPPPTEPNKNGNPRLSAAFSEWMMGWPAGWVTQVPGISRNDQLRIVGNGVCPAQAAAALRYLLSVSEVAA